MTTKIGTFAFCGVASVLLFSASVASAGILASHPDATIDTFSFPATGSQSASVTAGSTVLDVTVDYAVFEADDFNTNFGGEGYVPTGPLVYAYQVFVNNPSTVAVDTQLVLPVTGITDAAPGAFTANGTGDKAPAFMSFSGTIAQWFFFGPAAIQPGESSYGLAFSSTNVPEFAFNGGQSQSIGGGVTATTAVHVPSNTLFVPTPDPVVPEPTTMALLALSGLMVTRRNRKS